MAHSHHHHPHPSPQLQNLQLAFFLNLAFTLLEIIGGLWTNSMAIVADAFHDFTDSLVLGLSWYLEKYSHRESDHRFSYGYRRFSMIGALISGMVLISGSLLILSEVIPRLFHPEPTNANGMLLFAIGGILVNSIAVFRLRGGKNLNAQMISWHLLEDVFGWIAILIVSIILRFTDLYILDPILSILITLYVLLHVIGIFRHTLKACLMAVPEEFDTRQFERNVRALPRVQSLHHTHVWSLDGERHVLTTHVVVDEDAAKAEIIAFKKKVYELVKEMDCEHITVEIEYTDEECGLSH